MLHCQGRRCSTACVRQSHNAATDIRLMSSLAGTVPSPRLSFNKTVVTLYRIHLESRQLAPGTINVRLAAVRRLAYEAADSGLLSPELAAAYVVSRELKNWASGLGIG